MGCWNLNDDEITYKEAYELIKLALKCLLNACLVEHYFKRVGREAHKCPPSIFKLLKPNLDVMTELTCRLPRIGNQVEWL